MSGTFDYDELRDLASELIDEAGQTGAIRRSGAGAGDPWNPDDDATADIPCRLVETEYSLREVDGTRVRATDRRVLLSVEGVADAPTTRDRLVIGDNSMEIISVMPLSPGGIVLMWTVQARGS